MDLILEAFYRGLSPEVQVWVRRPDQDTIKNAVTLITFLPAGRGHQVFYDGAPPKTNAARGKCVGYGGSGSPNIY